MYGYMGRILWVDLTSGAITEEPLTEKLAEDFMGGYGIGCKLIFSRIKPGIDPLGPENILGFMTGPLTGTPALFGGRYTVVGKSPLTGTWGDANSGGFFGPELRAAGYDGVFFTGRSETPVYLAIIDGKAEIRDAGAIWGKDVCDTEAAIRSELGDKSVKISCIGPAGEKLALFAAVMNDEGRAAGRSGLGAVMGSKKLKAVAVRGSAKVPVADEKGLRLTAKEIRATFTPDNASFVRRSEIGTCAGTADAAFSGDSPVKNWGSSAQSDFTGAEALAGLNLVQKYQKRKFACKQCPVACGGIMDVPDGPFAVKGAHKPEYETLAAFGNMTLNNDPASIIYINDICNRAGLDTISAGGVISFAIECFENGILTIEDTGGIKLNWGNAQAIIDLLGMIVNREGLGDILAEGVKRAAEKIGKGSEVYAIHAGGQELPMHDPRNAPSLAVTYVADATPGRHTQGGSGLGEIGLKDARKYVSTGKGAAHAGGVKTFHVMNASGCCLMGFFSMPPETLLKMISQVTGREFGFPEMTMVGERIACLRQAFNVREGILPGDVTISGRALGKPALETGPLAGITIDLDSMKADYFKAMEWDLESGKPSKERLEVLGNLDEVISSLYKALCQPMT